jgi:putative membrane protein
MTPPNRTPERAEPGSAADSAAPSAPAVLERSAETLAQTSEDVKDTSQQISATTERMKASTETMKDSAERRTEFAADRTVLAAERTYAAWVRTGLASLASGIGAKKLLEGVVADWMIVATGSLLVLFSAMCFAVAVWRDLFPAVTAPNPNVRRLPSALLVAANGFLVLVALAALFSIWFGRTGGD